MIQLSVLIPLFLNGIAGLAVIVGFLLPYLIRILNKDIVDDNERLVVTYLVCFLAAMIIDYKSLSSGDLLSVIAWFSAISVEAHASFKLYFAPRWAAQDSQGSMGV